MCASDLNALTPGDVYLITYMYRGVSAEGGGGEFAYCGQVCGGGPHQFAPLKGAALIHLFLDEITGLAGPFELVELPETLASVTS